MNKFIAEGMVMLFFLLTRLMISITDLMASVAMYSSTKSSDDFNWDINNANKYSESVVP